LSPVGVEALPPIVGEGQVGVLPAVLALVVAGPAGGAPCLGACPVPVGRAGGGRQMSRSGSFHARASSNLHSTHPAPGFSEGNGFRVQAVEGPVSSGSASIIERTRITRSRAAASPHFLATISRMRTWRSTRSPQSQQS